MLICSLSSFASVAAGGFLLGVIVGAWATLRVSGWLKKNT